MWQELVKRAQATPEPWMTVAAAMMMLGWLGLGNRSQFDPTRFVTDEANRRLTAVSHAGPIVSRH